MVTRDHDHANAGAMELRHGGRHLSAQRVGQTHQAQPLKRKGLLVCGPILVGRVQGFGHAQHAQAALGQLCGAQVPGRLIFGRQMAQLRHGLGRAFGGDHVLCFARVAPHMAHGQQRRRQRVFVHQSPLRVVVVRAHRQLLGQGVKGLLHGVVRRGLAGEHGAVEQRVKRRR